jgi:hypothetical protein
LSETKEEYEMASLHEELVATVVSLEGWGYLLLLSDGTQGYADSIKAGDWTDRTERLSVGQELAVVVLDDRQDPVRVSALHADIEAARDILANRPANGDL